MTAAARPDVFPAPFNLPEGSFAKTGWQSA